MKKIINTYIKITIFTIYILLSLQLPNFLFRDRDNYVSYARSYHIIYNNYIDNGFNIFFNEPLFLFINYCLSWLNPNFIPYIFVLFIISTFFYFLSKLSKNILTFILGVILFFVISYTFHYQFVILRQAIATSILMITLFWFRTYRSLLLVSLLCSFIHSSFFLITLIIYINFILKDKNIFISIGTQLIIYLSISSVVLFLAKIMGIRQANDLINLDYNVGGGAFLLWFVIFIYLLLFFNNKKNTILYNISISYLTLFLSLYFFNPIVGRIMCSAVPFIILLLVQKSRLCDIIVMISLIFVYLYLMTQGILFDLSLAVDSETFFKELNNLFIF